MKRLEAIDLLTLTLRRKHLALSTEETYRYWLVQYLDSLATVNPTLPSEKKIERFLTGLALRDYSASSQNQAFNALLFFYRDCLGQELQRINALRAKKPITIRNAPSVAEVRALLAAVEDASGYPTRLIVKLLYGCGLRVNEPLNLRIRDVLLNDSQLIIRAAKGGKDRVVALPCSLVGEIQAQLELSRIIHQRDRAAGIPVQLPGRVEQKYPAAQFSRQWAFVFPMAAPCRHPRTGQIVRYRVLDCNVQRAIQRACRKLDLEIKPHELRHAYATHTLNAGINPRAIQAALGHKSLETTMGYLHAAAVSVPSPLETIILCPPQ